MNTPHKHAEVIKAWADGAKIEYRQPKHEPENWEYTPTPGWHNELEYRVKIEPKKYKAWVWLVVGSEGRVLSIHSNPPSEFDYDHYHVMVHALEGELPNE